MRAEIPVDTKQAQYAVGVSGRSLARTGAILLGVIAAAGCFVALPATIFRTHALLVLEGGPTPLHTTLIRIAADIAVSKPVIDRAAAILLTADIKAPAPNLAERLSVSAGAKSATSRQARLAESIAPVTRADPGLLAGTLEIAAAAASPEEAARIADALAEAFVTQQDDAANQARMREDEKAAGRIDGAKAAALAARQRLIALGGVGLDPVQARNAAAAQTAAAETRLASIRAIMASGSPPLSERKDLPPALAVPQAAYLDLKDQLAKQGETLGERHTTIIALQDGVKRAAATLSAGWSRLKKIAEADVVAARDQETTIRKSVAPSDMKRRDAIEDARRSVQVTEEFVAAAQRQRNIASDEVTFRMIARAPVPKLASGLSMLARTMLSVLAGLAGVALVAIVRGLAARRAARAIAIHSDAPAVPLPLETSAMPPESVSLKTVRRSQAPQAAAAPVRAMPARFFDDAPETPRLRRPAPTRAKAERASVVCPDSTADDKDLVDAMRAVLDAIERIEARGASRPSVMVAANEDGLATTSIALALGRAAADRRWQVLIVEAERATPILAAAADMDAEPVLIDLYGTLRIGLAADRVGSMTLAPMLRDGPRLAGNLAKNPSTFLIDDLVSAFDLVIIDGGVAEDAAAAGWTADAFVRVGERASRRDDEAFCATFDVASTARIATILPSASVAESALDEAPLIVPRSAPSRSIKPGTASPRARAQPAHAASPLSALVTPRRKIAAR